MPSKNPTLKSIRARFKRFRDDVADSRQAQGFSKGVVAACINGPCSVIECIVREAEKQSGIDMDWSYCGGRGFVVVKKAEQIAQAKSALFFIVCREAASVKLICDYD